MEPYSSRSGKRSGVSGYEIGSDYILVRFVSGKVYKYSYGSCGSRAVEQMKALALQSEGLSTFIAQQKPPHDKSF